MSENTEDETDENDKGESNNRIDNIDTGKLVVGISIILLGSMTIIGLTFPFSSGTDATNNIDRNDIMNSENGTSVVVFYGEDCANCDDMINFVNNETEENEGVDMLQFEVWNSENGEELYQESIISRTTGVPAVQIGDSTWFGFSDEVKEEISEKIEECNEKKCGIPEVYNR